VPAQSGTPEQIEQDILLREVMDHLTEDEWLVCHTARNFARRRLAARHVPPRPSTTRRRLAAVPGRSEMTHRMERHHGFLLKSPIFH
jgi:hypothetical protein